MKRLITPLLLSLLLLGCGPSKSEYRALMEENQALKGAQERLSSSHGQLLEENRELTSRLDELTMGPKKLYGDLLAAMELKDYATAYRQGRLLIDRFGESTEAIRAKTSVAYAQTILEKRTREARSHLSVQHDYASGATWYYHRDGADTLAQSPLYLYIGQQNGQTFLRIRVQRSALGEGRWIGFEVQTGDESFKIPLKPEEIRQKSVAGGVWQWHDRTMDEGGRQLVRAIVRSQGTRVLFFGEDPQEIALTPAEVRMIAQMLEAYDALSSYPLAP